MKPVVDRLQAEYGQRIAFVRYDLSRGGEPARFAERLGVSFVPTYIFVLPDGTNVERFSGSAPESRMRELLDSMLDG